MSAALFSVLIFMAVAVCVTACYYLATDLVFRDRVRARERLQREFRKGDEAAAPSPLFKHPSQLDIDLAPAPAAPRPAAGGPVLKQFTTGLRRRLRGLLEQADVPLTPGQLLGLAAGLGLLLGVAATWFRGPLLGVAAAAAGAAAPPLYVRSRCRARREKVLAQLPAAFELMARVLRAGNSVPQALQSVTEAFDGPLALEFAKCQKQQNLGLRPEVTFQEVARRTGILEVRIFVTAMLIQRQTGGNLSEVLERLAGLIRDRLRIRRQVRTLTAEGRLQGLTLLVLPFLVFGALMIINRQYAQILLDRPSLLLATGAVMGVGVLWIRHIVNLDV